VMVGSTGTVVTVYRSLADMPPAALALFRDSVGTERPAGSPGTGSSPRTR
jgi:hypothetical protein